MGTRQGKKRCWRDVKPEGRIWVEWDRGKRGLKREYGTWDGYNH